jgi:hypothetical protein
MSLLLNLRAFPRPFQRCCPRIRSWLDSHIEGALKFWFLKLEGIALFVQLQMQYMFFIVHFENSKKDREKRTIIP